MFYVTCFPSTRLVMFLRDTTVYIILALMNRYSYSERVKCKYWHETNALSFVNAVISPMIPQRGGGGVFET